MLEPRVRSLQPYLLLVPALAILVGFLLFPLIWNIYLLLHDVTLTTILGEWKYVGVKNFSNLLHDPDFHKSLQVSLIFVGGSVALQFFVGMVLAVVLNQQITGSNVMRALFIIPWTVSAVIAGFSFKFIFNDSFGVMNYGLGQMGLDPIPWLSDPGAVV
jgi:multiple sugar transport system permease protein